MASPPPRRREQRFAAPLLPPQQRQHRQADAARCAEDVHDAGGAAPAREAAQPFGLAFDRDWDPLAMLQVGSIQQ